DICMPSILGPYWPISDTHIQCKKSISTADPLAPKVKDNQSNHEVPHQHAGLETVEADVVNNRQKPVGEKHDDQTARAGSHHRVNVAGGETGRATSAKIQAKPCSFHCEPDEDRQANHAEVGK